MHRHVSRTHGTRTGHVHAHACTRRVPRPALRPEGADEPTPPWPGMQGGQLCLSPVGGQELEPLGLWAQRVERSSVSLKDVEQQSRAFTGSVPPLLRPWPRGWPRGPVLSHGEGPSHSGQPGPRPRGSLGGSADGRGANNNQTAGHRGGAHPGSPACRQQRGDRGTPEFPRWPCKAESHLQPLP